MSPAAADSAAASVRGSAATATAGVFPALGNLFGAVANIAIGLFVALFTCFFLLKDGHSTAARRRGGGGAGRAGDSHHGAHRTPAATATAATGRGWRGARPHRCSRHSGAGRRTSLTSAFLQSDRMSRGPAATVIADGPAMSLIRAG
jgi:hypothetical protein